MPPYTSLKSKTGVFPGCPSVRLVKMKGEAVLNAVYS